jgi:pimeloyl-ACP methyl ester carboxylesterase
MKDHRVAGGGGVQLHLVETGKSSGRPIVFIHGFSQCGLAWNRQLGSDLADDFRLVAMDLRGHGLSDKPSDAYGDSKLWADDVDAAIKALRLDHPILCGWSYGPLVILDYIRHYGEGEIGGSIFVGGVTKLGSDAAVSVLTPEFLGLMPGFFSTDVEESARTLESLIQLCVATKPSAEEMYLMLGYNLSVPPHVRKALFSRAFDNDDLLPRVRKPVLIVHGAKDGIVKPEIVGQHKAAVGHAGIAMVAGAGHAPFWDDAAGFNRLVREFAAGV